jgi:hypothetical protein
MKLVIKKSNKGTKEYKRRENERDIKSEKEGDTNKVEV